MAGKGKQHKGAWSSFIDRHGTCKVKQGCSRKRATKKIQAKIALGQFKVKDETKQPFDFAFTTWRDLPARVHGKTPTVAGSDVAFRAYFLPTFGQKDIGTTMQANIQLLVQGAAHLWNHQRKTFTPTQLTV